MWSCPWSFKPLVLQGLIVCTTCVLRLVAKISRCSLGWFAHLHRNKSCSANSKNTFFAVLKREKSKSGENDRRDNGWHEQGSMLGNDNRRRDPAILVQTSVSWNRWRHNARFSSGHARACNWNVHWRYGVMNRQVPILRAKRIPGKYVVSFVRNWNCNLSTSFVSSCQDSGKLPGAHR